LNELVSKSKEVLSSVLPIVIIVFILNFTLTPLETPVLIRFILGAVSIIIGLTIFLLGVDIGITPIGISSGSAIAKTNKILIVIVAGLILGFFISIAEPDLHILAQQVDTVTSGQITKASIVLVVSVGIAVMVSLGLARIVYNVSLYKFFIVTYLIIFALGIFAIPEFLAISFDASGATTGAMTVPFLLALARGVSKLKKDSKASEEDSFGLVGIASAGAIIGVLAMNIILGIKEVSGNLEVDGATNTSILGPFLQKAPVVAGEVLLALLPIILVFLVFQKISFKLSRKNIRKILIGVLFSFVGLVLFLTGVNAGFMEVGSVVGYKLAILENRIYVIIVAYILGLVTILAEPAVYVLTRQIEDVTSGYVKRKLVMVSLCIGVGFAVALSIIRIILPGIQLWHYLLPGYIISILMTFFVPNLFVGVAFDSGGVASGPMTATFILAFAHGVAEAVEGADVMVDGFGVIAMVALTPLIALQVLGFIYKIKSKKGGIEINE
jgi:hypothetical protein